MGAQSLAVNGMRESVTVYVVIRSRTPTSTPTSTFTPTSNNQARKAQHLALYGRKDLHSDPIFNTKPNQGL